MTQIQNKTRYNYGASGGANKGKQYNNYNLPPITSPEAMQRCTEFKKWFSANYASIKQNLTSLNKYDDDVMVDTFLKIYRSLEYGTVVKNYRTYWETSYFTNNFKKKVDETKYQKKTEYIEYNEEQYDSEDTGDSEAQYEKKDELINLIGEWLECNVPDIIDREIFIIYINTKNDRRYKMTYEKLSDLTGVDLNRIKEIIPRIKKQLQEEFKNNRLNTL